MLVVGGKMCITESVKSDSIPEHTLIILEGSELFVVSERQICSIFTGRAIATVYYAF